MVLLLAALTSSSSKDAGETALPVAADGTTALHVACRYGHEQAVRLLLDASGGGGAGGSCKDKDSSGRSAADVAALWGRVGVLRLLQEATAGAAAVAETRRAPVEEEEGDVRHLQKKARSDL
jgi:ankyrin repeat protein